MKIPYRTQQRIKYFALALLVLLLVAALVWCLWFLWLQRYVRYTRDDGAVLDFEMSATLPQGQSAVPPAEDMEIEIFYNEGEDQVNISTDLQQMTGYYVTGDVLGANPAGVWEQIQALPGGTPIMLDLKSIYGYFYYSTNTGRPVSSEVDVQGVDNLLNNLRESDYYTIARIPALRDREYGLAYTNDGVPVAGGYLWMDAQGCYWLNPGRSSVLQYLTDIASELKALGFDEVVFTDFSIPNDGQIVIHGDRDQTLTDAAQTLVDTFNAQTFAVSFVGSGGDTWTYPTGRSRVYRTDVGDVISLMEATRNLEMEDPAVQLVFVTNSMDTRFEEYSVLRPLAVSLG